jgi:membrane protein
MKTLLALLKGTFSEWSEDDAPRLAAALAYYTVFSLAPLLLVSIAIAGLVFGQEAARGEVVRQIEGLMGRQGAEAVQQMIQNAQRPGSGILAGVAGLAILLFGASGVMNELQAAMNRIWDVEPRPGRGVLGLVKDRLLSFTMVLAVGFVLLVSLVLSAAIAALGGRFSQLLPLPETALQALNFGVSLGVIAFLFTLIFKYVPDVEVRWRDVWPGALATAVLFTIGKLLIGLYLGRGSFASSFGAAGSLVALLAWVYYSAQILFLGAELTQVYARRHGAGAAPSANAQPADAARAAGAVSRPRPERRRGERRAPVPSPSR